MLNIFYLCLSCSCGKNCNDIDKYYLNEIMTEALEIFKMKKQKQKQIKDNNSNNNNNKL